MYILKFLSLVLSLVLLSSCAPILATPSPAPAYIVAPPVVSAAVVQSVEVEILDGGPSQVNAIIRGQLPDGGCTTISSVDQVRNGNTFNVQLMTTTDPLAICNLAATPFEKIVPLEQIPVPYTNRPRKIASFKGIFQRRTVNELGICSKSPTFGEDISPHSFVYCL